MTGYEHLGIEIDEGVEALDILDGLAHFFPTHREDIRELWEDRAEGVSTEENLLVGKPEREVVESLGSGGGQNFEADSTLAEAVGLSVFDYPGGGNISEGQGPAADGFFWHPGEESPVAAMKIGLEFLQIA